MPHNEANINWIIQRLPSGNVRHEDAELAVLMDIRDELRQIPKKPCPSGRARGCAN